MHHGRSMVPPPQHAIRAIIPHHGGTHGPPAKAIHPACTHEHKSHVTELPQENCLSWAAGAYDMTEHFQAHPRVTGFSARYSLYHIR